MHSVRWKETVTSPRPLHGLRVLTGTAPPLSDTRVVTLRQIAPLPGIASGQADLE